MTRHRFDPFSFIAGGIAVSVAVAVLIGEVSIRLLDLRIAGPVLVLLLGLALLLGGGRDRAAAEEVGPTEGDATSSGTSEPGATDADVTDSDAEA